MMADELVRQTCWGQDSDGSHHTRSEVTSLNEVNGRLESVPAQCDVENSRISSKADSSRS